MATKPELKRAVPKSKIKAVDYNKNFDSLNDYIEQGIADNAINNFEFDRTYKKGDWVLANVQGHNALYESLINENKGNSITNTRYWKPVVTGGNYLFDLKISDHDLYGEEALGWALQGTYVSDSIYNDFCARCFMEKEVAIPMETEIEGTTITLYKHDNGHVFYDIADKGVIDTLYEKTGMAWYYGIDLDNLRVFLPRNKNFVQFTDDFTKVGEMVEAGLPNIVGETRTSEWDTTASGAFTSTKAGNISLSTSGNSRLNNLFFDASLSNSIYGNSDTVQPNAIKKLLYICVGNTVINPEFVDVANLSSDLQFKADKTDVDGQWVGKTAVLTQSVASGVTEIDMAEYLPNDDYQYEVLLICGYYKSSTAYIQIYSDIVPQPSSVALTVASSGSVQGSYVYMPIGTGRKLYQHLSAATTSSDTGKYGIEALAYRRLGKNV